MADLHTHYALDPVARERLVAWEAAAREVATQIRAWSLAAVWDVARSATVAASTAIEGNTLTEPEVQDALGGGPIRESTADVREILNYNEAMNIAARAAERPGFQWSEDIIQQINAQVVRGLATDTGGRYRTGDVRAGIFQAPNAGTVPPLMGELVRWLQTSADPPLIRSALVHLNLIAIHPFDDGNGRTARILSSLDLMRDGVLAPELLTVETYIRANRDEYVDALRTTLGTGYDPEQHSATPWIEYYTRISLERLGEHNRLMAAMPNDIGLLVNGLSSTGDPIDWTPILLSARYRPVRTSAIARRLELSPVTVRAEIAAIVRAGWLVTRGNTRARRYEPSERLLALPLRTPEIVLRLRSGQQLRIWDDAGLAHALGYPGPAAASRSAFDPGRVTFRRTDRHAVEESTSTAR